MYTWVMQYRERQNEDGEWSEWKNLPKELFFSSYYAPLCFEFRAQLRDSQTFVFRGTNESSYLSV